MPSPKTPTAVRLLFFTPVPNVRIAANRLYGTLAGSKACPVFEIEVYKYIYIYKYIVRDYMSLYIYIYIYA